MSDDFWRPERRTKAEAVADILTRSVVHQERRAEMTEAQREAQDRRKAAYLERHDAYFMAPAMPNAENVGGYE